MALTLNGTSAYLKKGSSTFGITAEPMSFAAWVYFNSGAFAALPEIVTFQNAAGSGTNYWTVYVDSGGHIIAGAGSASSSATTLVAASTGVWVHVCGVFVSTTSRNVYLNGGNKVSNTVTTPGATVTETILGAFDGSTPADYLNGYLAGVGIWSGALVDADVSALYAGGVGFSPRKVRPDILVSYTRGVVGANEPDLYSATVWSPNASGTQPSVVAPSSIPGPPLLLP